VNHTQTIYAIITNIYHLNTPVAVWNKV